MKTAVVTGGAGFIGSWLCESLVKDGYYIICIDNLITGSEKNIKDKKNILCVNHDVSEPIEIDQDIDLIFHLASPATPVAFKTLNIEILKTNSLGTINMLELAKEKKAKFLLASTSEVYGDPKEHPQKETYWGNVNCIGIRSCYDESKRFAESFTVNFGKKHNIDVKIARIFNTYGPRMQKDDGRVLPNFINQALKNKDITVYGDGSQTRSFCYIEDNVKGLRKLMDSDFHEPVNIGSTDEMKIINVATLVKKTIGSGSKIVFKDLPENDPVTRRPDITRAKEKLNWKPETPFEQGLKKTINFFKEN